MLIGCCTGTDRHGWSLLPVIVKSHDDLRQEEAVSQMLRQFDKIFREGDAGVWLRPYEVGILIMLQVYDGYL